MMCSCLCVHVFVLVYVFIIMFKGMVGDLLGEVRGLDRREAVLAPHVPALDDVGDGVVRLI